MTGEGDNYVSGVLNCALQPSASLSTTTSGLYWVKCAHWSVASYCDLHKRVLVRTEDRGPNSLAGRCGGGDTRSRVRE